MTTTLRRSGIGWHATARVQDGADRAEDEPEHEVGGPDPVPRDGGQAYEADAEEHDDGDPDDGDDDAEDDAPCRDDGRADGLVVDGGDHRVDGLEGPVRQRVRKIVLSHGVETTRRSRGPWQGRWKRPPRGWARRGSRPPGRGRPRGAGARWRCRSGGPGRRRSRRRRRRPRPAVREARRP